MGCPNDLYRLIYYILFLIVVLFNKYNIDKDLHHSLYPFLITDYTHYLVKTAEILKVELGTSRV